MILFAVAGIVYILQSDEEKLKNTEIYSRSILKNSMIVILFVLFVISFIYLSFLPAKKSSDYAEVFGSTINKSFDTLLLGSHIGMDWDVSGMAYDAFRSFARNPVETKNNKEVLPYVVKDLTGMLQYLESIAKNNKTDYRLYISMVDLYNTKTYLTDAPNDTASANHLFDLLTIAHKLSPTNPEFYWIQAQIYAWSGDMGSIIQSYQDAIAIDPSIPVSHNLLIQFAVSSKNQKLYTEAVAQAEKDIPNFTVTPLK